MTQFECVNLFKKSGQRTLYGEPLEPSTSTGVKTGAMNEGVPAGCNVQEYQNGKKCTDEHRKNGLCTKYVYFNTSSYKNRPCGLWGRSCLCKKRDRSDQEAKCACLPHFPSELGSAIERRLGTIAKHSQSFESYYTRNEQHPFEACVLLNDAEGKRKVLWNKRRVKQ